MSTLLDDLAEQAIHQALGAGPRLAVLCAIVAKAGDMIAETDGHGEAAAVHARRVRIHEQRRCRLGAERRNRR